MNREIEALLKKATEPGSQNTLSVSDIREWLVDYLEMRKEEIHKFPEEAGLWHWDLLAADGDSRFDALFAVAIFDGDNAILATGRGPGEAIRYFGETDFPDDPNEILPEISRQFHIFGDPIRVNLNEIMNWLKTSS